MLAKRGKHPAYVCVHDTKSTFIVWSIVLPPQSQTLGIDVGGRAEDLAVDRHRDFADFAAARPKSMRCGWPSPVHHDVGRLQVAMDDALLVGMVQGIGDFGAQLGRLAAGELLAGEPVAKVTPRTKSLTM